LFGKSSKKESSNSKVFSKSSDNQSSTNVEDTTLCIICATNPINVLLIPCGHAELCNQCSSRLNNCCTCRKQIEKKIKLYAPFN
jgi:hypothetical protein